MRCSATAATAIVRKTPWVVAGTPHLCIVCDYHNLKAIEATSPHVVEAIWRAAQSGRWRALEWKPLEIEWPKIAVVNLVAGKALLPACAAVSTLTFLATSQTFEAKLHHYAALPVTPEDFARGGFQLWGSPLLRGVLTLQGDVVAFTMTNVRFYQLANLVLEQDLEQGDADRILDKFSLELVTVLTVAQRSYSRVMQILETAVGESKDRWMKEFPRICQILLLDVDENSCISLNLDTFCSWMNGLPSATDEFQKLISEIVVFALEKERTEQCS